MINAGLYSSEFDDWNTPEIVLSPIRVFGGGPIGLDPCGNAHSIVGAIREYRLERGEDGLKMPWQGLGLVFGNFPYGDAIAAFMRRADAYGASGVEIIALVPNRSDTAWYQDNVANVAAKCEWRRPAGAPTRCRRFTAGARCSIRLGLSRRRSQARAPFPSALLYWGHQARRFGDIFGRYGRVWR